MGEWLEAYIEAKNNEIHDYFDYEKAKQERENNIDINKQWLNQNKNIKSFLTKYGFNKYTVTRSTLKFNPIRSKTILIYFGENIYIHFTKNSRAEMIIKAEELNYDIIKWADQFFSNNI